LEGARIEVVPLWYSLVRPPHPEHSLPWPDVIAAAVILVAITAAVLYFHRTRYLAMGWFLFVTTLIPVIGIVQVGRQAMADRSPTDSRDMALSCLINSGEILLNLGDYETAEMRLAAALQIDPNNSTALQLRQRAINRGGENR
jgi:hypothetical protein